MHQIHECEWLGLTAHFLSSITSCLPPKAKKQKKPSGSSLLLLAQPVISDFNSIIIHMHAYSPVPLFEKEIKKNSMSWISTVWSLTLRWADAGLLHEHHGRKYDVTVYIWVEGTPNDWNRQMTCTWTAMLTRCSVWKQSSLQGFGKKNPTTIK